MVLPRARSLLSIIFLLASLSPSIAISINVTVDDEYGDEVTMAMPKYSPDGVWSFGPNCTDCPLKPDASQAYDGTWHSSDIDMDDDFYTVEVNFTGYAVYAYFILANNTETATTHTYMTFSLDGSVVGSFEYDGTNEYYQYDFLAYFDENLEKAAHTFVLTSVPNGEASNVMFDRLVYTAGDAPSSSLSSEQVDGGTTATSSSDISSYIGTALSSLTITAASQTIISSAEDTPDSNSTRSSQAAVIGGSIAGVIAIIALSILAILCMRRRRRRRCDESDVSTIGDGTPYLEKPFRGSKMAERRISKAQTGIISFNSLTNGNAESLALGPKKRGSLYVAPPSSEANVRAPRETAPKPDFFLPEKDPFRRDELDRPSLPSPAATRIYGSDRATPNSSPLDRHRKSPEPSREGMNEQQLLERIATLQVEVDLLQDRHSKDTVPPPEYYGDGQPRAI